MEHNRNTESDSDPSTQMCINCGHEKPIDQFIARTKAKQRTKWCSDCRHQGREGHKRWAAKRKLKTEGENSPPSQDKMQTARSMGSPEGTQASVPSQISYQVYPSPEYASYVTPTSVKDTNLRAKAETVPSMGSAEGTQYPIPSHIPYHIYPGPGYPSQLSPTSANGSHPPSEPQSAQPASSPNRTHVPIPSQMPYQIYPSPIYAPYMVPGAYGPNQPPGSFQILTPPLNLPPIYPGNWGYGSQIPVRQSPHWVTQSDFSPRLPVQEKNQPSSGASEAEDSKNSISDDGTSSDERFNDGNSQDGIAVHVMLDEEAPGCQDSTRKISQKTSSERSSSENEGHGLQHQFDDSEEEDKETDELLQGKQHQVFTGDPEPSKVPHFKCLACNIARPKRLEDSGICVYCFEHPTQYCIKGGHEDDKISFVDSDGQWHEVCNRCRSDPDPP